MRANSYSDFSRKDRIGILVLVLLILFTFLLPELFSGASTASVSMDTNWIAAIRKLEIHEQSTYTKDSGTYNSGKDVAYYQYDREQATNTHPKGRLVEFDPNTITIGDWKSFGLRDKTIGTIRHYLEKGGRFRTPEDLQRVYGLSNGEYLRLRPFIKIVPPLNPGKGFAADPGQFTTKAPRSLIIDINTSDTAVWIALPGIGSKLAARIVNFREKLGGFYSISQVAEVYGLADSVFQKIKQFLQLNNAVVKRININTATPDELKVHPYIRYAIANAIIAYRNEHGPFLKTEDLKKIRAITEDVYIKMIPYLVLE